MTALSHSSVVSTTPYVWSLVLSLGTLLISIILIYIARFQAKLEIKDLAALRTMFDRYPAWGNVLAGHSKIVLNRSRSTHQQHCWP
jgi:hypothetical protein